MTLGVGCVLYAFFMSLTVPASIGVDADDLSPEIMTDVFNYSGYLGIALCVVSLITALAVRNVIPKHDIDESDKN